jgi:hypothetical protein
MNNTTSSKTRRTLVIVLGSVFTVVVIAALFITASVRAAIARPAALRQQVQGTYVFKRASDGVIYTADFRADGVCYFKVQPTLSSSYSTGVGHINGSFAAPGFENGLERAWDVSENRGNVVVGANEGSVFKLAGRDLVLSDGSVYARVQ